MFHPKEHVPPGGDGSAFAGSGNQKSADVLPGQSHGGIEADYGKAPGHLQDRLNYRLPYLGVEVIQLGSIVPRHMGSVVTMIDIAYPAAAELFVTEDNSSVGALEVVVFQAGIQSCRCERFSPLKV